MASWYKQQLLDWVSQIDVKADTVIDIGGSQDPVKGRTKSWDVNNYLIADLPQPHYEKQPPDLILDLDSAELPEPDAYADLIFCLEVFDYIKNPYAAFRTLQAHLKQGGSAWVSFPFIYPHHNPIEDDGLRYTESAIRYYGNYWRMPVQEVIYRRPRSELLLRYFAEDGFRSAPNYDHNVIGYIVRFQYDAS